jgi:hypothetical protein
MPKAKTSNKSKYKKMKKEDKKNNKDWAAGARETIMEAYLDRLAEAKLRGKAAEDAVFEKLFRHYHAVIDWRLPDHKEPPSPMLVYDEKNPPPPPKLTAEEEKERKTAIDEQNVVSIFLILARNLELKQ